MLCRNRNRIFISYRRDDTSLIVGRIVATLRRHLGSKHVFLDLDDIPAGAEFSDYLRSKIEGCNTTLVLIGPRWRGAKADGSWRIHEEGDHVRIEARTALMLPKHTVIPILIGDATLPKKEELPPDLAGLVDLNAYRVDPVRQYEEHMGRVTRQLIGAWWRSRMRCRQVFTALAVLVPIAAYLIGQQWYQAHLRDARLAAQQSAIEKMNPVLTEYMYQLRDHLRVLEASAPRAYMNVRREEEERNVEVRDNYSSAHQALFNAMPDILLSVREGWGTNDSVMVATWFDGLQCAVHEPIRLRITPMIVKETVNLKTELWRAGRSGWSHADSLAWDSRLKELERAYAVVMPDLSKNVGFYDAQLDLIRNRLSPE